MDSQIHENADGQPDIDRILAEADAKITRLVKDRAAITERRRASIAPRYEIVLGGGLVNHGLSAIAADALAG